MEKITPCIWYNNNAHDAAKFYVSIFKNSKIKKVSYYDEASSKVSGMKKGSVLTVEFTINGQTFTALNGGPVFQITPAISFIVNCKDQKEIDYYWNKLSANPQAEQCGWLQDKYGVSWQIVPTILEKLLRDKDPKKAERVMVAMLEMKKLDIKKLKEAYGKNKA